MLESLDITVERVRAQVVRIVGCGEEVTSAQVPFTPRAKKVLELALREASSLGHNDIGTEHILLGLVRENEGVAMRVLLDLNAEATTIRREAIRVLSTSGVTGAAAPGSAASGLAASGSAAAGGDVSPVVETPALTGPEIDFGWRGRAVALAALGAAVTARSVFDRSRTGGLEPLEMKLLARLTLGPPDDASAQPGELFESLKVALVCDHEDLRAAIQSLENQQLIVSCTEEDEDERLLITTQGLVRVDGWLRHAILLFGTWPPDHAAADDATG